MKIAGGWLIGLGIIAVIVALFLPTQVDTPKMIYSEVLGRYSSGLTEAVFNLGLLQRQALVFQAGLATIVSGVALFAAGVVVTAVGGPSQRMAEVGGTATDADPVTIRREHSEPATPLDTVKADRAFISIMVGIVLVVFVLFTALWNGGAGHSPEVAAIEANADAMAMNMEVMADNLEALADEAAR